MNVGDTGTTPLSRVEVLGELQAREGTLDADYVAELTEAIKRGDDLPPILVVEGKRAFACVDGFHRYAAHLAAGRGEIAIEVVAKGGMDVARWHAAAANPAHGKRRSKGDVARAIRMAHEARPDVSDRELARHLRCSHTYVAKVLRPKERTNRVATVATPANGDALRDIIDEIDIAVEMGARDEVLRPLLEERARLEAAQDSPAALSPPMLGSDPEAPGAVSGASPDATSSADGEVAKGAAISGEALAAQGWADETVALLRDAYRRLSLAAKGDGPMARTAQAQRPGLKKVLDAVRLNAPVACPRCEGQGCDECQERGWVRRRSVQ